MSDLPAQWDPRRVAVNRDERNRFLLRPGQILVAPGDVEDVRKVLTAWKPREDRKPFGITLFETATQNPDDPANEVLAAINLVRRRTAGRPQGPVKIAPNHVFVGEADAITFTGEPRIQGGPGSSVRRAKLPTALPKRGAKPEDGKGVTIAVLDTGMFDHEWLKAVQRASGSDDMWDVEHDGYADNEAGHGMFIAGLILQVAPAATVYVVKVLDSHGVGDDLTVALAMEALPQEVDIVNLSLGGYTDDDSGPLAVANALKMMRSRRGSVVAAAGNDGLGRPFWPAAFKQVVAVGAVDSRDGHWTRASFSNHGWWVDAAARGVNLESTFTRNKTKVAQGPAPAASDPTIAFGGWASWDGTSFASPIAAALLARAMTRNGFQNAIDAEEHLRATAPAAPQPDFPLAVLLDELAT